MGGVDATKVGVGFQVLWLGEEGNLACGAQGAQLSFAKMGHPGVMVRTPRSQKRDLGHPLLW